MDPAVRLDRGLEALGLRLAETQRRLLLDYVELLGRWNRVYNLTAVRDPAAMVARHVLDSLTVLPHLRGDTLLDVGSGAGLPGLVVAVARPALAVTLLDANGKKTRFCRQAAAALGLPRVTVVQARVEDFRPAAPFDTVVSRAFAEPAAFVAACAGLAAPGGVLVAMAGRAAGTPQPAGAAIHPVQVPGVTGERHLVVVEASAAAPAAG